MAGERLIFLDTETTGLSPKDNRIVEFAGIEVSGLVETGTSCHLYFNPGMPMPPDAQEVHGLTDEFLADKPLFSEKAEDLATLLDGATIVAHNAPFDVDFLTSEFRRCGMAPMWGEVIDTLRMARLKFPGGQHNLDALCRRFDVDLGGRVKHGAMIDTRLLISVYIKLAGLDRLNLAPVPVTKPTEAMSDATLHSWFPRRPSRPASGIEIAAHAAFVGGFKEHRW